MKNIFLTFETPDPFLEIGGLKMSSDLSTSPLVNVSESKVVQDTYEINNWFETAAKEI